MKIKIRQLMAIMTLSAVAVLSGCQEEAATSQQAQPAAKPQIEAPASAAKALPKTSVQLWSVKDDIARDFKGTLESIAAMGFDAVEFAGNFGPYAQDTAGLKTFLDSLGLEISGAHVGLDNFTPEKFSQTVAFYKAIGTPMLIVPMDKRAVDPAQIDDFIALLNDTATKVKAEGMGFGFHNHAWEFDAYQDTTFWDHIANNTNQDFILQLDVGWVTFAGQDAAEYVRRYPNRTITTHYKAKFKGEIDGKRPIIGDDITNWKAVIASNIEVGGTQWFVVEQEEYPDGLTPLESVAASKRGLDRIIAKMGL